MLKTYIFMAVLVLGLGSISYAQGQIASCTVVNPKGNDITAVKVFEIASDKSLLGVVFTLPSGAKSFPSDEFVFSSDGSSLNVRVAKFIILSIRKGQGTRGSIGVALGAPPSDMLCDASW